MPKKTSAASALAAGALALTLFAPATASAAPVLRDGDWVFTGRTYSDDIGGRAQCWLAEQAEEANNPFRDYDCHWGVPLKMGIIGLWYR
ncbi:hypothetical protein ACWEGE_15740 [Amycolatopsis sp. NPDC004747]